jgi:hypothetical protein
MNRTIFVCTASALLGPLLLASSGTFAAASGPGPFNTGVNAAGAPLASNAIDPHYSIVNSTVFGPAAYAKHDADGPPITPGTWLVDGPNAASSWLVPDLNFFFIDVPGVTDNITYRTTFDLTGFAPNSFSINGRWAADDSGLRMRLNGVLVPGIAVAQYDLWTNFAISSGFQNGINTLEFDTRSTQNPTGLRVEMTSAVPEPGTWLMCVLGLAALHLRQRRAKDAPKTRQRSANDALLNQFDCMMRRPLAL